MSVPSTTLIHTRCRLHATVHKHKRTAKLKNLSTLFEMFVWNETVLSSSFSTSYQKHTEPLQKWQQTVGGDQSETLNDFEQALTRLLPRTTRCLRLFRRLRWSIVQWLSWGAYQTPCWANQTDQLLLLFFLWPLWCPKLIRQAGGGTKQTSAIRIVMDVVKLLKARYGKTKSTCSSLQQGPREAS